MILNDEKLSDLIKNGVVLVDFFADWCGPCKMMNPILASIESGNIAHVVKVNADLFPDLAKEYMVNSLPTILLYIDGELKQSFVGATPKPVIINAINSFTQE